MRIELLRILFISLLLVIPVQATGPVKVALLIGNQSYTDEVGPLKNPHTDVELIGASLRQLGFKVTTLKDATYRQMDVAMRRHVVRVQRAGRGAVSFVYYSGHGVANPKTKVNYVIPVDVKKADDDLWFTAFEQSAIIDRLKGQARNAVHYVVFDACRNELNLQGSVAKSLGQSKGFVPIANTTGILVAYATAPGMTASDDGEGGGPYAKVLAEELLKPGVEAVTMFRNVQIRVKAAINQDPWLSVSAIPSFHFNGREGLPGRKQDQGTSAGRMSAAAEAWLVVQNSNDVNAIKLFQKIYGSKSSFYNQLAAMKLASLGSSALPAASAPVQPKPQPIRPTEDTGDVWMRKQVRWLEGRGPVQPVPDDGDLARLKVAGRSKTLKLQSSFGSLLPILGTDFKQINERVKSVTGGKVRFKFEEPGALVPALESLDAVGKGDIDAAWTTSGYAAAQDIGFVALTGSLPFGLLPHQLVNWVETEGEQHYDRMFSKRDVKGLPCHVLGPEGTGWFKKPINSIDDLKGKKIRFFGIGAKVIQKIGVSTQLLAGADIYPALEKGVIDGTEFSMPYIDVKLGFYQIAKEYYYPAWHQPTGLLSLLINLKVWNGLHRNGREAIKRVCRYTIRESLNNIRKRQRDGLDALAKFDARPKVLPVSVLSALRSATKEVMSEQMSKSPAFRRIYKSFDKYRE